MEILDQNGDLKQDAADVLYELGNVGVGTAVVAIGNIRKLQIQISTPNVLLVEDDIFSQIAYDSEQVIAAVGTRLNQTMEGRLLFLFSREFVRNTVYHMTGEQYPDEELLKNEDSLSALHEIVNYMTAGYAQMIGSYLGIPVYINTAEIGIEKARVVVEEFLGRSDAAGKKVACVNTRFTIADEEGRETDETGHVLIFPEEESIEKFMEIMKNG